MSIEHADELKMQTCCHGDAELKKLLKLCMLMLNVEPQLHIVWRQCFCYKVGRSGVQLKAGP